MTELRNKAVAPRHIAAATIGNAMEFYDFMIFAFFAIQIGQAFFPSGDAYASLMASLATFGAGFVTRPLGAWVLGRYGDRHGRSPAMMASMALMGFATLLLVLCPGYARIGAAAPVIAVIARLLQGFAVGGEVGPSTAFMLEGVRAERRGLSVSLQRASQTGGQAVGALVGLALSLLLPADTFREYGWRIALGLGALVAPYALYLRRHMPEPEVPEVPDPGEVHLDAGLVRTLVCAFFLLVAGTICSFISSYMPTFAQSALGLSASTAMSAQAISFAFAVAACLAGGHLSDRIGRRVLVLAGFGLAALLAPPLFAWMIAAPSLTSLAVGGSIFAALLCVGVTSAMVAIIESLPRATRSLTFALVYTVPVTIFGGTTQMLVTWAIKASGTPMAVAWVSSGAAVLALAALPFLRESAPARFRAVPLAA